MKTVKAKRKVSRNKPKRPMSAYNFFFKAERARIAAASGNDGKTSEDQDTFEDIGRTIGKRWKEISEEELNECKKMASKDSDRYHKEMAGFFDDKCQLMSSGDINDCDDPPSSATSMNQLSVPPDHVEAAHKATPSSFAGADKATSMEKLEHDHLSDLLRKQQMAMKNNVNLATLFEHGSYRPPAAQGVPQRVACPVSNAASYIQGNLGIAPSLAAQQQLNNLTNYSGSTDGLAPLLLAQQQARHGSLSTPQHHSSSNPNWTAAALQALIRNNPGSAGQFPTLASTSHATQNNSELSQVLKMHLQFQSLSTSNTQRLISQILSTQAENQLVQQHLARELEASLFKRRALEQMLSNHNAGIRSTAPAEDERKPSASMMSPEQIFHNARQESTLAAALRETSNTVQLPINSSSTSPTSLQQLMHQGHHQSNSDSLVLLSAFRYHQDNTGRK